MVLRFLTLLFIISTVFFLFTQIFWPAWNDRHLFPMFRKNIQRARQKLSEAREQKYLAKTRVLTIDETTETAELEAEADDKTKNLYDDLLKRS